MHVLFSLWILWCLFPILWEPAIKSPIAAHPTDPYPHQTFTLILYRLQNPHQTFKLNYPYPLCPSWTFILPFTIHIDLSCKSLIRY